MLTADQVLDAYFLDNRCMLLEMAAMLDRYDAARKRDGNATAADDPRMEKIQQSLAVLSENAGPVPRAERLLELLSDPVQ